VWSLCSSRASCFKLFCNVYCFSPLAVTEHRWRWCSGTYNRQTLARIICWLRMTLAQQRSPLSYIQRTTVQTRGQRRLAEWNNFSSCLLNLLIVSIMSLRWDCPSLIGCFLLLPYFIITARLTGPCFAHCRLSSSVTLPVGNPPTGCWASGRSGGWHCMADQFSMVTSR